MRLLGLRHDIVAKDNIYYVVFYDIDNAELTDTDIMQIDGIMYINKISYLLIKTKNGHHVIGLTPLTAIRWAGVFNALQEYFKSYYGGIVIRLSRKEGEEQKLVQHKLDYGEVIPNLFNCYAERFGLKKMHWQKEFAKYLLVFEKYRTEKQ